MSRLPDPIDPPRFESLATLRSGGVPESVIAAIQQRIGAAAVLPATPPPPPAAQPDDAACQR